MTCSCAATSTRRASHEHAARELHLSRAAYFRRLRSASERVAAWLYGFVVDSVNVSVLL